MAKLKTPQDLLGQGLREIHAAERQAMRALPRIAKSVSTDSLRQSLEQRRVMAQDLIEDLDEIFDEIDVRAGRAKNATVEGMIEDCEQHAEEAQDPLMRDAIIAASAQKLLHYCIAAWGTERSQGQVLGQQRVAEVMQRVLDEGKRMDQELTNIAEREIYPRMMSGGQAQAGQAVA